jgi:hypothetical protein
MSPTGGNMEKTYNQRHPVTTDELLVAQMIQIDTITQLLLEKGIFREDEFFRKLKQVQAEYVKKKTDMG